MAFYLYPFLTWRKAYSYLIKQHKRYTCSLVDRLPSGFIRMRHWIDPNQIPLPPLFIRTKLRMFAMFCKNIFWQCSRLVPAGTFLFIFGDNSVIILLNSRYCFPYCWLPIEKVTADRWVTVQWKVAVLGNQVCPKSKITAPVAPEMVVCWSQWFPPKKYKQWRIQDFPCGGHQPHNRYRLLMWLCFKIYVCQNERIRTLVAPSEPPGSTTDKALLTLYLTYFVILMLLGMTLTVHVNTNKLSIVINERNGNHWHPSR